MALTRLVPLMKPRRSANVVSDVKPDQRTVYVLNGYHTSPDAGVIRYADTVAKMEATLSK